MLERSASKERVFDVVQRARKPLQRSEIARRASVESGYCYLLLRALVEQGRVRKCGSGSSTFYLIAGEPGERLFQQWLQGDIYRRVKTAGRSVALTRLCDTLPYSNEDVVAAAHALRKAGRLVAFGALSRIRYTLPGRLPKRGRRGNSGARLVYRPCTLADGSRGTEWMLKEGDTVFAQGMHLRREDAVTCAERYFRNRERTLNPLRRDLAGAGI